MSIIERVAKATVNYPPYSQENTKLDEQTICIKLFDIFGSASWYITEYDPKTHLAFGYVEGLVADPYCDEWGYISIFELSQLKQFGIPRIEVDKFFTPKRFGDVKVRGR